MARADTPGTCDEPTLVEGSRFIALIEDLTLETLLGAEL